MVRFKMLATDFNSPILQKRTWVVDDYPDWTASLYTGLKSGRNKFINFSTYQLTNPSSIMDFSKIIPTNWQNTEQTIDESFVNSQLAIIDGYVYLFGGKIINSIYRASLANPTIWQDTNNNLPIDIYSSQLAVINDTIYLFGGRYGSDGYDGYDSNVILSAPTSNPLNWSIVGSLPIGLSYSQLIILNNYIYLFGGKYKDVILRASVSNPLSWSVVGNLPIAIHNSTVTIMDGYIYLLGGQNYLNDRLNTIYQASVSTPLSWSLEGNLPNDVCGGQFITIGDDGYLFTSTNASKYKTNILQYHNGTWFNTSSTIPGTSEGQIAIIDDRLFMFGSNAAIYTSIPEYKYLEFDNEATRYAEITRTEFRAIPLLDTFELLGFPSWKTNYR